eukprot:CAMPEP_0202445638 /NCGR_PEP_ID=MMETSP1360-20130828/4413_1 /ASSEMBLY_ACC=CAM_ASM_000848 /TAXON_ID=515479 /ORGANISM="Licmophora paradoxa, Strain CCMP2313" /LENGTH=76 /DNA_ID=CAMNT_0049061965 /DNA_START=395 /DNA_END=626 /DNA_ORIENTATION=-
MAFAVGREDKKATVQKYLTNKITAHKDNKSSEKRFGYQILQSVGNTARSSGEQRFSSQKSRRNESHALQQQQCIND